MRALVVALIVVVCACTVNRKSDGVKLDAPPMADAHLIDARMLDAPVCPAGCNGGCVFGASPPTCMITGAAGGAIVCPTGFHCKISCSDTTVCGDISCTAAAACEVNCVGTGAGAVCGVLSCGTHKCNETCVGAGACGNLFCASACSCDASCTPASACATMSCPRAANKDCTTGGVAGAPCNSNAFPQCGGC